MVLIKILSFYNEKHLVNYEQELATNIQFVGSVFTHSLGGGPTN